MNRVRKAEGRVQSMEQQPVHDVVRDQHHGAGRQVLGLLVERGPGACRDRGEGLGVRLFKRGLPVLDQGS